MSFNEYQVKAHQDERLRSAARDHLAVQARRASAARRHGSAQRNSAARRHAVSRRRSAVAALCGRVFRALRRVVYQ